MSDSLRRASFCLAFGSAVAILVSIAVSQILLGASLAVLLLSGAPLRFPPIRLPLAVFFALTVIAMLFSPDPAGGIPQLRKFFVYAIVLVIASMFRTLRQVRALVLAWAGVGSVSALIGIAQFLYRRKEAIAEHADNYAFFLDGRITGFAGHWMTFGGEEMIVLLMAASLLLFARRHNWKIVCVPPLVILAASLALGMTRCIFLLGVPLGLAYLVWQRRHVLLALLPIAAAAGFAAAPAAIQQRIVSVVQPHGDLDSNAHRAVCRAVGWEMVKAHPWLGLGPEQIGRQFDRYIPARIHRPLPHGWYGHLHNIYLQYAAERGIPALAAMLWTIGKILCDFWTGLRHAPRGADVRWILQGAVAVILAILAEGLFEYNLGDSEVLTLFLCVVACGYVAMAAPAAEPA